MVYTVGLAHVRPGDRLLPLSPRPGRLGLKQCHVRSRSQANGKDTSFCMCEILLCLSDTGLHRPTREVPRAQLPQAVAGTRTPLAGCRAALWGRCCQTVAVRQGSQIWVWRILTEALRFGRRHHLQHPFGQRACVRHMTARQRANVLAGGFALAPTA